MSGKRTITQARQVPAGIEIESSRLRSTNLERDIQTASLSDIYVGVRAQDMLERVASSFQDTSRTRAWSLTGPYGSGKSTLALVTASLVSSDASRRAEADKILAQASPSLARRLAEARDHLAPEGFLVCVATARPEPLLHTVARAVRNGVSAMWPESSSVPEQVRIRLDQLGRPDFGNSELIGSIRVLASLAPVMLVIDEFGKSLEHLASRGEFADATGDVFLLQELAELGAGIRGLPLFLFTLQHLSFSDYASRTTALQTREWAKIQGRFEDVLMTTHLGDAVELIRRTIDQRSVSAKGRKLIEAHAAASAEAWSARGLESILPADEELFASVYPLHPLTVAVAPLLAAQIGQHDRSMTGFIANDEPHTVRRFLASYGDAKASSASTVRLSDVYDFFFTAGRTTVLASVNANRWMEIDLLITEANGLPDEDVRILKTIGMLNLVDASGALRASMDTILLALCDPAAASVDDVRRRLSERVESLKERGFVVHRAFSDEFRVWRGSDVDLTKHIDELIAGCDDHAAVKLVSEYLPTAVVAGKHSQRTGMLRHFITKTSDAGTISLTLPDAITAADGLLIFHFGDAKTTPDVHTDKPVIVGVTPEANRVLAAARYLHALAELPAYVELDSVARNEVSERTGQASAELATRVAEAFAPNRLAAKWFLLLPSDSSSKVCWTEDARQISGRSLAALVSVACETVFPQAPHIRNEMLGRHTLTSQGAKARRELMLAMINSPDKRYLGIEGYGPERAIYSGVLEYLGLHQPRISAQDESTELVPFGYVEPAPESTLYPAWAAMNEVLQAATERPVGLDTVFARLEAPPFGVRPGVTPIIVLTALVIGNQEYAVFEEGTYQVSLTEALVERILKNPERFAVKCLAAQAGPRKAAVKELASELGSRLPTPTTINPRNVAPLTITRVLLDRARTLSPYADRTQKISKPAQAVRQALKTAREPDKLLFNDLPTALGLEAIPASGKADNDNTRRYAESLGSALAEIASADNELRKQVTTAIADAFHAPNQIAKLRKHLAATLKHLSGISLTEPRLQGVIDLAQDSGLTDDEWLDPFVVRVAGRGLNSWSDSDLSTFANEMKAVARSIDRLAATHQPAPESVPANTYSARVITLTRPDGHEESTVIHIPDSGQDKARSIAADAIRAARKALGRHGERVLLAMLAEAVMTDKDNETNTPRSRKKP